MTILVADGNNLPLSGVQVSGNWNSGQLGSASCTTGADGTCQVTRTKIPNGYPNITFAVTNLVLSGYTYNSTANTVTSIVVNHP